MFQEGKRVVGLMLVGLFAVLALSGCGGLNMALTKDQAALDMGGNGVVLATVHISNQYKTGYQPEIILAQVKQSAPSAESFAFKVKDDPFHEVKDQYNDYLLSFSLKPGDYTLSSLWGRYRVPLLINANCVANINAPFRVKQGVVSYIGNFQATIVERTGDEERAGSAIPLIDQAVAGFSGGTFVFKTQDHYDADVASYKQVYSALRSVNIEKSIAETAQKAAQK